MKSFFAVIVICTSLVALGTPGYCQYTEGDDSAIEQTESQMGQGLDGEIAGDKSQGQAEMDSANEDMNTGRGMQ